MHEAGVDVSFLARRHIKAMLEHGLLLTDYQGYRSEVTHLQCVDTTQARPFDVVWLTVKCTAVQPSLDELAAFVGQDTIIMCCQNGLGSDQIVRERFPNNQVLRVMVPFNVVLQENEQANSQVREVSKFANYHRGSEGTLCIEKNHSDRLAAWMKLMNSSCLDVAEESNMTGLQWAKLQLNLGNSVNALADIPVKAMLMQRNYRLVIASLMDELLNVAQSQHIQLPKVASVKGHWIPYVLRLPDILFKLLANKMLAIDPTVRTSMWWDIKNGKPTEIQYLNGAVERAGQALGIACPINNAIIALISKKQNGELKGAISASELRKYVLSNDSSKLNG